MLLRSFMFVPAQNEKFLVKALSSNADALILDLEDSVPAFRRPEARDNIKRLLQSGQNVNQKKLFVRINEIGTIDFVKDIEELTCAGIAGFVPSKIHTAQDIVFIDKLLSFFELAHGIQNHSFLLAPLIEETSAVEQLDEIAASSGRLVALCFGGEDYLNDLGCMYQVQHSAQAYARGVIVNSARAHGLLPIDSPYLDVHDQAGFEAYCREAFMCGFAGNLLLNPIQIEAANRVFFPSEAEIAEAEKIMAAIHEVQTGGASGVAMLDGTMIGPPLAKRAKNVLELAGQAKGK